MSLIDYRDSAFSFEDDYQLDGYNAAESDSYEELDFDYDEDDILSHYEDVDEYAVISTDYEKYQLDQKRWDGIANPRKYLTVKEKAKGKAKSEDQEEISKEDTSACSTGLEKSDEEPNNKPVVPSEQAVTIPKGGEIHFDARGNLWYSHKKGCVYLSGKNEKAQLYEERSTFHHWIRPDLSRSENAKGIYDFPRKRGRGSYDTTCFNEVQEHWGLDRAHYAPVMFEWERLNRGDPGYQLDNLYYQDLLVIDYWCMPVRNFREIPLVISSEMEGGFMEPATRMHSKMAYEDIRARMPPFLEVKKRDQIILKALSKASVLSGRSRHFREAAGAISWDKREGSSRLKVFIEKIVKPMNNSTLNSRDLTKNEIKQLRLMNGGTKPARAKVGTSKKAKEKYIADLKKAAELTSPNVMTQKFNDVKDEKPDLKMEDEEMSLAQDYSHQHASDDVWHMDYSHANDGVYNIFDDHFMDGPMAFNADIDDQCVVAQMNHTAPPRFVFCCTEPPFLQALTEQQAIMHPLVDMSDPRNQIPKLQIEVVAIRDALQVTVDHFMQVLGYEPMTYEGSNYVSEYCNIQDQFDDIFQEHATSLRRLGRWEGTVFDWEQAHVEDDPCIGRMTQPYS